LVLIYTECIWEVQTKYMYVILFYYVLKIIMAKRFLAFDIIKNTLDYCMTSIQVSINMQIGVEKLWELFSADS